MLMLTTLNRHPRFLGLSVDSDTTQINRLRQLIEKTRHTEQNNHLKTGANKVDDILYLNLNDHLVQPSFFCSNLKWL